eukprot:5188-Heterococcus_DN1.PRE.3
MYTCAYDLHRNLTAAFLASEVAGSNYKLKKVQPIRTLTLFVYKVVNAGSLQALALFAMPTDNYSRSTSSCSSLLLSHATVTILSTVLAAICRRHAVCKASNAAR